MAANEMDDAMHSYKPGSIRSIKMVNFMCHDSFELPLGPRVNFVIGPNGSGKSALLTAIVVALGGRATTTLRAKKNSEFIMYGKSQAKVTVIIHNYDKVMEKDQAFKPDDYGKFIIIEKTLHKDDVAKLCIKNDREKKISERKQELDQILEHFGILINNPICILNQEISKTFLHSKKPEDKFELFMKATNLEQIEQDYQEAHNSHKDWGDNNNRKSFAFKLLENEYAGCMEKARFISDFAKLSDTQDKLNKELHWAVINEKEAACNLLQKKIDEIQEEITKSQEQVEKRKLKIRRGQEEIEITQSQASSIAKQLEESKKKLDGVRSNELAVKTKHFEVQQKVAQAETKIKRHQAEEKRLKKSIDELKKQYRDQDALDNDNERKKLEIERLDGELEADKAKIKSLRLHTKQLNDSMTSTRTSLISANQSVSDLKTKLAQFHGQLGRIRNGQQNALRKYGDHIVALCDEINRDNRFKKKPIGPLGFYIKLRNPEVGPALETHLGKNAHAFACDNHQDMLTLNSICRKLRERMRDFRQPVIIIRPFNRKHDTNKFKAAHTEYKTLLDYIDVDESAVFNALVDKCFLESVLYIPEYVDAEALMISTALIPKNTRMAYTRDCSVMHPRTGQNSYKSFNNDSRSKVLFSESNTARIEELQRLIELTTAELRDAEANAQRLQKEATAQRKVYDANNAEINRLNDEIRKKEEQLLDLKTLVTHEPQELSDLESERESILTVIGKEELSLAKDKESLNLLQRELSDIAKEREQCQDIRQKFTDQRAEIMKRVEDIKRDLHEFEREIKEKSIIIENRKKEKLENTTRHEEAIQALTRSKLDSANYGVKPSKVRKPDLIVNEIKTIENQFRLFQEELRDPSETMQILRKRLNEIEGLMGLKESNQKNFDLTAKSLEQRDVGFRELRTATINKLSATFSAVMRTMRMNGELRIYLNDVFENGGLVKKAKTLEMRIDTNYNSSQRVMSDNNRNDNLQSSSQPAERRTSRSQPAISGDENHQSRTKRPRLDRSAANTSHAGGDVLDTSGKENEIGMTDARSLSGGERSFSTVAFVLALWHHCASPFKLMDEIDVFMDMVTRRISYNALIRYAQVSEDTGQFVFFSPLELPRIDNSESFVRVFEMPAIVRKRPHDSQA